MRRGDSARYGRDTKAGENLHNSIRDKVRNWWHGQPYENEPGSPVIIFATRRHWTARACRAALEYARVNHQWLIMAVIAAAGVIVAALKLGSGI